MYNSSRSEITNSFLENSTLTGIGCVVCGQEPTYQIIQKHKLHSSEKAYICKSCLTIHKATFTTDQYALRELQPSSNIPMAQVNIID